MIGLDEARKTAVTDEAKAEAEREYAKQAALLQKRNEAYNKFCEENDLKKLNDRITIAKWDRKQAAQARGAAKRYNRNSSNAENEKNILANSKENGKMKIGLQFFAKSSKDFKTVILPKSEYAHVMSELATHLTKEQASKQVFSKAIGKYIYTVENNGFGEYRIIKKVEIKDDL